MRLIVTTLLLVAACAGGQKAPAAPVPAAVSRDGLQGLRWLEGRWATERNPYLSTYLAFTVTSDTSLQLQLFDSNEFDSPYNTIAIVLAEGRLRAHSGDRAWVATHVDSTGVRFATTSQDVYEALALRRSTPDGMRLGVTWHQESDEVETRTVMVRRVLR